MGLKIFTYENVLNSTLDLSQGTPFPTTFVRVIELFG